MHVPTPAPSPESAKIDPATLKDEVAEPQLTGIRALWDETVASGLTPGRLATIMKEVVRGDIRAYLTLAEEMEERYPHYAAVLGTRKRAMSGIKPIIAEASTRAVPKEIVEAVTELLEDEALPDLVENLMDGIAKGFSVSEILWEERQGKWWPKAYVHRDPKYFTFDYISRSTLRLAELGSIDGTDIPPGRMIQHMPRLKAGIPIRAGLARQVAWMFMLASFTLKDWIFFMDVFGMPLRLGKYHPNATADEKRALLRAVVQMASDAGAIIPESMSIEFIDAKSCGTAPFDDASRFINEQVSKLVLGQTMTSDNGSSLGQAKVHNEIRLEIKIADARMLTKTINRDLVRWFVALNWGKNAPCPRAEFPVPKPEDVKVMAEALGVLVPLGLEVGQDEIRGKLGIGLPREGEKLLKAPLGAKPMLDTSVLKSAPGLNSFHGGGCRCTGCQTLALNHRQADPEPDDPPDAIDQIGLDDSEDWEPQTGSMVAAILGAARASTSYEDFTARLNKLYGGLDTKALEARLALALMKAHALGQATDEA